MNSIDKQYTDLLKDILENGHIKKDRTGTGTISVYGRTIRHKMSEGFPLLTTKKMYFKGIVTELLWFLRGETNIKYLVDNGCHIWDGDAYKNFLKGWEHAKTVQKSMSTPEQYELYLSEIKILSKEEFIERIKTDPKFAAKWGELGPIYGKQWRRWDQYTDVCPDNGYENGSYDGSWTFKQIDQIADTIHKLKTNPDDRGIIVSAWNVGELDKMVLRPCHNLFQFYTRELTFEERWDLAIKYGYVDSDAKIPPVDSIYMGVNERESMISMWNDPRLNMDLPKRAISLMWYQRSCDVPLGLPFNIASYALLLEIYAKMVNMVPDELIGNLGDTHIYLNQIDAIKEQISRPYTHDERVKLLKEAMGHEYYESAVSDLMPFGGGMSEYYETYKIPTMTRIPYELPILTTGKTNEFFKALSEDLTLLNHLDSSDFAVTGYKSHPTIKIPLSN